MNCLTHFFLILLRTPSKSHHEREIAFSHQLNISVCAQPSKQHEGIAPAAGVCSCPSPISPVLIHRRHHPCASLSCQDSCQTTTKFMMTTEIIEVAAISWRMPLDYYNRNAVLFEQLFAFPLTQVRLEGLQKILGPSSGHLLQGMQKQK